MVISKNQKLIINDIYLDFSYIFISITFDFLEGIFEVYWANWYAINWSKLTRDFRRVKWTICTVITGVVT